VSLTDAGRDLQCAICAQLNPGVPHGLLTSPSVVYEGCSHLHFGSGLFSP
jgi:hypothetical protein